MAVSHIKSNIIPDFTGTVTVFDSNGLTATTNATALVRPSDWNSAHNQFMTLGGNTAGASTVSGTNVVFQGAGALTLTGNGDTLVFNAPAQTVQTQGMVSINGSTGAIVFSNSNNVSFGVNASTITATASFAQTEQTQSRFNLTLGGNSTSAGAGYALISSGVMTLAGGNNITLSQNGNAVTVSAGAGGGGIAASLSGNSTSGGAGYSNVSSGTLILAGGNNITLSQDGSRVTISGANLGGAQTGISGIAANGSTFTSGSVYFSNLGNISISTSVNGASQYVQLSGNPAQTQQPMYFSASGTSTSANTIPFGNSNGVSFSLSNGSVVATVKTDYQSSNANYLTSQSNQGASASNGQFTFQTLNFSNANNVTFGTSAGGIITASVAAPAAVTLTNYATGNTTQSSTGTIAGSSVIFAGQGGISAGISNGSVVISGPTLTSLSVTGALSASSNGSTISLGVGTVTVTATGNTTQASSGTINLNAMIIQGGGNISAGISNGSIVISATGAGGGDGINALVVNGGASSATTTLTLSNSNNVSFGLNAGVITASASFAQSNQTLSMAATSNTAGNTSGMSVDARSITFAGYGIASVGYSTSAGGSSIVVSASQTVQTQASGNIARTGFTTGATAGSVLVGTHDTAGLSLGVPAWITTYAAQTVQPVAWSGSGGSSNFSTLNFSNASNISFSNSNGSIQVVHNLAGISTGTQGANITLAMTHNSSGLNLSASVAAQSNQTGNLYVTANSTQLSSTAGIDYRSLSFAGAGNISVGVSQGVVVISQTGGAGGGIAASISGNSTSGGAGYSNISSGTMILAGGPNITLSQDGSRISISAPNPGAAAENNWMTLLGANVSGNSSASGSTIGLSGVNMTLSGTNNSQIVFSVPATSSLAGASGISISTNGSTISIYQPAMSYLPTPLPVMYTTQTVNAHMQSTSQVFPIYMPENLSFAYIRMLQSLSLSSMASIATTANFTRTVLSQAGTFNFVLYARGVGANSLSLQSIGSTQHTSGLNVVVTANANGSQWTMSNNFSFPNSATASTGYTTGYATTLSNLNASSTHLASINGLQFMEFPFASSLSAGNYWMAIGLTTGALTTAQTASYSRFSIAQSFAGAPQTNQVFSQLGSGGAASIQAQFGIGSFTTAGGGTTGSMPISAVSSQASHIIPWVTFARIA